MSRAASKRSVASLEEEDDDGASDVEASTSKRARGGKAKSDAPPPDKVARKEARMHRNKIAAQASRDRKKNYTETLERRVAELEAQVGGGATPPSTSQQPSRQPSRRSSSMAAAPPTPPSSTSTSLEEENATLRSQLVVEQLQSANLKARLGTLEDRFAKLETLLSTPTPAVPSPSLSHPDFISFPHTFADPLTLRTDAGPSTQLETMDSSRLPAQEVSLQRKLSIPLSRKSSVPTPSSRPLSPRPRPTLSEVLASIQVPLLVSTSRTSGMTGRPDSGYRRRSMSVGVEVGRTKERSLGARGRRASSMPTSSRSSKQMRWYLLYVRR